MMRKHMTPEALTEKLQAAAGGRLRAVILYGSAAAGDHAGKRSDYNILVVTDRLDPSDLDALAPVARDWTRCGNPPPLLFTEDRLRRSADVFPIEIHDMKEAHRVLFGEDVLEGVEASSAHLRLEIEHELRGKLIQLRERYLLAAGRQRALMDLMLESLSAFLVLFRAALRLFRGAVPATKLEAVKALAEEVEMDVGAFVALDDIKRGGRRPGKEETRALFARYLRAVEAAVDAVDARVHVAVREE